MSVVENQALTLERLLLTLRPHFRHDPALPARIQALLARHKEFGGRDRRLYREIIYATVRYLPWLEPWLDTDMTRVVWAAGWLAPKTRDTAAFKEFVSEAFPQYHTLQERSGFLSANLVDLLPSWMRAECPLLFESPEFETQLARAPLWLRLQTDDVAAVEAEFSAKGWLWCPSSVLPDAWRMLAEADVTKTDIYREGKIEVQDLGSQMVLGCVGVGSGEKWLDACAGAGGKTLQLARILGASGHVDAHDIRPAALEELAKRAKRAELKTVSIVATPKSAGYDGVLVDAPCSGSGTWRRAPHLKWTTGPETVRSKAELQSQLLAQFSAAVKPGGRLVYATCSLARSENEAVIETFIANHPEFAIEAPQQTFGFQPSPFGMTILPSRYDTDGFFVSVMSRRN